MLDEHDEVELLTAEETERPATSEKHHRPRNNDKVIMVWPRVQRVPTRLSKRLPSTVKAAAALALAGIWLMLCITINNRSLFMTPYIGGNAAKALTCGESAGFWEHPNQRCGIDGQDCIGSQSQGTLYIRCPANCKYDGRTFQKTSVGSYVLEREPLVVGGNNVYRPDSTLCAAAVHHGAVSNAYGGCAKIRQLGPQPDFISETRNGITSISFNSSFVSSFEFVPENHCVGCTDRRLAIAIVSITFSLITGYLFTSPALFIFTQCSIGFWTLYFGVDAPSKAGTPSLNAELVSTGFQRMLPTMLGVFFIHHVAALPQLHKMPANLSRAVLWCGPFWVGLLENYTFARLPIDRMMISDFNSQAGGWAVVIVLAGAVLVIGASQAVQIWRRGDLKRFVVGYGALAAALILLSFIPNENLRIHHYIIGLILVPGTYLPTSPSMAYQGLCVGLFISGAGRWGLASILETAAHVHRNGDEEFGHARLLEPAIRPAPDAASVVLKWESDSPGQQGYSLILNDFEVYRGESTSLDLTEWAKLHDLPQASTYYVRVALANGDRVGPYTLAGMIDMDNGHWTPPPEGHVV